MSSPFSAYGRPMPSAPRYGGGGMDMSQLRNMYRSISGSANPMQALQQMMGNNPMFAQINNLFRQGQTPEGIFRAMAKQRGIDPDQFIRELRG